MVQGARAAVFTVALAIGTRPANAQQADIIPLPATIIPGTGTFQLNAATAMQVPQGDRKASSAARYLAGLWMRSNGLTLAVSSKAPGNSSDAHIVFRSEPGFGPEAYRLEVAPTGITVSATTDAGLFYGAATLWQLLPPGRDAATIPAQTIIDEPRYPWRGLMLDSARHFQSPGFVRAMIDWMSWHKLNVLHWHLTDDQGWRLEIKKYPRLTSVGAWRSQTIVGHPARDSTQDVYDHKPAGGFYTQDDAREIVAYAKDRFVTVVPEIEMPGHSQAAIAAYPMLGNGDTVAVWTRWGVTTHILNPSDTTI